MTGVTEKCQCKDGYVHDANGECRACTPGYKLEGSTCVLVDPCASACKGAHQTCIVQNLEAVCGCQDKFVLDNGVCIASAECNTRFEYENAGVAGKTVFVTGDFDAWSKSTHQMAEIGAGKFEASFFLEPGVYGYKYYVKELGDDGWFSKGTENGANNSITVKACGEPSGGDGPALSLVAAPDFVRGTVNFQVKFVPGKDASPIDGKPEAKLNNDGSVVDLTYDATSQIATIVDPGRAGAGKLSYTITAKNQAGVAADELFVPVWAEETPFNWRDAVLYFAFTDRFFNGKAANDMPKSGSEASTEWMGGDYEGLRQKVEAGYFDKLGVNTLWLSSVSMNTQNKSESEGHSYSGYHSYWPISTGWTGKNADLFASVTSNGMSITPIEPHFGTMEELKALIDAAHKRGIRVLVDFAANHVHQESPIFIKHQNDGWFHMTKHICNDANNWNDHPIDCWFAHDLPDINYSNADVRKLMIDHAIWLIKETNIDGFRIDAVKHMHDIFLIELREATDKIYKNTGLIFYMVGETFDYDPGLLNKYINDQMLHGQFDFPLYGQILRNILQGDGNYYEIKDFTNGEAERYNSNLMGTFMGNHDVSRAISCAAGDCGGKWGQNPEITDWFPHLKLKLAWTVLMTSPGVPLIYYGDEFGLEGANDPDNRRMMKFDGLNEQQGLTLAFVQKLGKIREEHSALRRGKRQNIDAYEKSWMYTMSDDTETILVGISGTGEAQTYTVPNNGKGWINLLDPSETLSETTEVTMREGKQIIVWKQK